MTTTAYHGLDSNSNPLDDSCNDDFYLGEMGMDAYQGNGQVDISAYSCMNLRKIRAQREYKTHPCGLSLIPSQPFSTHSFQFFT